MLLTYIMFIFLHLCVPLDVQSFLFKGHIHVCDMSVFRKSPKKVFSFQSESLDESV